ncbi:MAG: hypothetical protein M0Z46_23560 [Actinomycetota bacterium]|nr:hypothetical protein [Actinomycetota bacterium]
MPKGRARSDRQAPRGLRSPVWRRKNAVTDPLVHFNRAIRDPDVARFEVDVVALGARSGPKGKTARSASGFSKDLVRDSRSKRVVQLADIDTVYGA